MLGGRESAKVGHGMGSDWGDGGAGKIGTGAVHVAVGWGTTIMWELN